MPVLCCPTVSCLVLSTAAVLIFSSSILCTVIMRHTTRQAAADEHKSTILSASHWKVVDQALEMCEPIIKLLRNADSDVPTTGKIHYYAYKVKQHLAAAGAGVPAPVMAEVRRIWDARWKFMDSPLHGAAYCLEPEFLSDVGLYLGNTRDSCVQNLIAVIDQMLPEEERQAARMSYASFRAQEGIFGSAAAVEDAGSMPAHQWWEMYGCGHPELQKVAVRLLAQVSSACSCERAWSAYDFIHNKRRNRLTPARARDLVFVFTNGRLAEKMETAEESFVGWDEEEEMEAAAE